MALPRYSHVDAYDAIDPAARPFEAWQANAAPDANPVATLQAMIYDRFAEIDAQALPPVAPPPQDDRIETIIATISRVGGVTLFFAAVIGIGIAIF